MVQTQTTRERGVGQICRAHVYILHSVASLVFGRHRTPSEHFGSGRYRRSGRVDGAGDAVTPTPSIRSVGHLSSTREGDLLKHDSFMQCSDGNVPKKMWVEGLQNASASLLLRKSPSPPLLLLLTIASFCTL
ncbi:hypothetical protein J6590_014566 [Homalodisca vitripennis]|nr:hypothetical protein J6590_014566 [Homalodisca vitripennis]